MKENRSKNKLT